MPSFLPYLLYPLGFIILWGMICGAIAELGWNKLASGYMDFDGAKGQKFSWQSCTINRWASYKRCVNFHFGEIGLRISILPIFAISHPPLFVPWFKINYRKEVHGMFGIRYLYDFGVPRLGRIIVSEKIHQAIQEKTLGRS